METIIKQLENQIAKLQKEEAKHYSQYRKTRCGESFGKAEACVMAISKIEDAISKLKNQF